MNKCKHYVAPFCGHPTMDSFSICAYGGDEGKGCKLKEA